MKSLRLLTHPVFAVDAARKQREAAMRPQIARAALRFLASSFAHRRTCPTAQPAPASPTPPSHEPVVTTPSGHCPVPTAKQRQHASAATWRPKKLVNQRAKSPPACS